MPASRKYREGLSEQDRQLLLAAAAELKSRGQDVPVDLPGQFAASKWKTDSNGYFVSRSGRQYTPTDPQSGFVASRAFFALFYGSRGSGKTASAAQKAIKKLKLGQPGVIIAPDFEQLKISTWPEFREWLPWDTVVPSQRYRSSPEWEPHKPFSLTFHSPYGPAKVIIKGLKDPNSARGPNVNWLWYDEGGQDADGLGWKLAIAGVRIGHEPQAWVSSTPAGVLHWMHEFFIEQHIPEELFEQFNEIGGGRPLIEVFHGTMEENIDNLDPGFVIAIKSAYPSGYLHEQEIGGEFVHHEGALGDASWFDERILDEVPEAIKTRVRYWDLAASEKKLKAGGKMLNDPDATVGTLLSWNGLEKKEERFYIENQVAGHWKWAGIKKAIKEVALIDGPYVPIFIEQEPGAGGINQVEQIKEMFLEDEDLGSRYTVEMHKPEGDKVQRANVWFAEAAAGKFYMLRGDWNDPCLRQIGSFPITLHDDYVDSISGARACAAPIKTWKSIEFISI